MRMDLPLTGSPSRDCPLVRVDTEAFTLLLRGKPYHPTAEGMGFHAQSMVVPSSNTVDVQLGAHPLGDTSIKVYPPQIQGLMDFDGCPYPLFFENQNYYLSVRSKGDSVITFHHESKNIRDAVHQEFPDLLSGHLNFRNEVGFTELVIRVNGHEAMRLCLEIFPAKMDYRADYHRILHEEQVYNLAYSFLTRTFKGVSPVQTTSSSLTEFFSMFRAVFEALVSALVQIEHFPHHGLTREQRTVPGARVQRWDNTTSRYVTQHPNVLVQDDQGYLVVDGHKYAATKLPITRKIVHTNTHENRFVRWMIERIMAKVDAVRSAYTQMDRKPDPDVLDFLDAAFRRLRRSLQQGILRDVAPVHNMTVTLANAVISRLS